MNKCMVSAVIGLIAGMYIGYTQEEELSDIYRKSRRQKKKMMKKIHKSYDHMCDCMDLD
ncbi:hypothetical protein [Amedibacillus sp. YH-ame10]